MSRYGRLAHAPDNRFTPEDEACWRDLVACSRKAAAGLASAPVPALHRVTNAAKTACAPGVVTRDNPCVILVRLARRYCAETTSGRRELQAELATAAEAAEAALEAGQPRRRKDIDG
ncbi:MAG: hypothetical protein LCH57_01830 [Proteobacteria bacterium]|nr:hypothetical protein [Pseudomonadota bacterium]